MRHAAQALVGAAQALARSQQASAAVLLPSSGVQQARMALAARAAAADVWRLGAPRWSHCSCSGDLSLPPPQKVVVEYSPAAVDAFIELADAVEAEFEGIHVDGVEVPDRPHAFDVKLEDGRMVFSAEGVAALAALPTHGDLCERLREAGLQAATA